MTSYRYLLEQEVDGVDRQNLIDALEDETFYVRDLLGEEVMNAQIQEGLLIVDLSTETRAEWLRDVVEVLSVHLSEYIYALEFAEARQDRERKIDILKYVGRRGDVIAVPLTYTIAFPSGEITPGAEDVGWLEKNWDALPRWAQDGFRIKFPELRRL